MLLALRRGILERGIPENILTDNGSDFCAWDVGGRGHRKKNAKAEANRPPTIMEHLASDSTRHCHETRRPSPWNGNSWT